MGESTYFVFTLYTKGKRYGFTINAWESNWDMYTKTDFIFPTDGPIANIGSYCLEKFLIEFEKFTDDYTYWRKEHPFNDYVIPYVGSFSVGSSGGVANRVSSLFREDPNSVYHLLLGDEIPLLEKLKVYERYQN